VADIMCWMDISRSCQTMHSKRWLCRAIILSNTCGSSVGCGLLSVRRSSSRRELTFCWAPAHTPPWTVIGRLTLSVPVPLHMRVCTVPVSRLQPFPRIRSLHVALLAVDRVVQSHSTLYILLHVAVDWSVDLFPGDLLAISWRCPRHFLEVSWRYLTNYCKQPSHITRMGCAHMRWRRMHSTSDLQASSTK
jgi:hypothetical protein